MYKKKFQNLFAQKLAFIYEDLCLRNLTCMQNVLLSKQCHLFLVAKPDRSKRIFFFLSQSNVLKQNIWLIPLSGLAKFWTLR